LLGIELSKEQVAFNLSKMGYRIDGNFAYSPGYRSDVINEVDLIEDIAIAHGFNNFEPSLPKISTIGHARPESLYHEVLVGLGFDEVLTWTLSNPQLDEKAKTAGSQAVEMKNPMTSEYSQFRRSIIPNHLSILGESKDERLPIKIYEIGPVAVPAREERLAISIMHAKASFSEIKGVLLSLAKESGAAATLENDETPLFIKGRGAALYLDGKFAGTFGEVSPGVLSAFRIEQPVCIAELVL
jgi:phenylalanyl-tRNA synthetase beta chain